MVTTEEHPQSPSLSSQVLQPQAVPTPAFTFDNYLKQFLPQLGQPSKISRPICPDFKSGSCPRGPLCPDRHYVPPGERSGLRHLICKHYIRGLCKRGDACEYAHNFDLRDERECKEFSRYGICPQGDDCPYIHVHPTSPLRLPACPHYTRGFCPLGPYCSMRHIKHPTICPFFLAGFCPNGRSHPPDNDKVVNCEHGAHARWIKDEDLHPAKPEVRKARDEEAERRAQDEREDEFWMEMERREEARQRGEGGVGRWGGMRRRGRGGRSFGRRPPTPDLQSSNFSYTPAKVLQHIFTIFTTPRAEYIHNNQPKATISMESPSKSRKRDTTDHAKEVKKLNPHAIPGVRSGPYMPIPSETHLCTQDISSRSAMTIRTSSSSLHDPKSANSKKDYECKDDKFVGNPTSPDVAKDGPPAKKQKQVAKGKNIPAPKRKKQTPATVVDSSSSSGVVKDDPVAQKGEQPAKKEIKQAPKKKKTRATSIDSLKPEEEDGYPVTKTRKQPARKTKTPAEADDGWSASEEEEKHLVAKTRKQPARKTKTPAKAITRLSSPEVAEETLLAQSEKQPANENENDSSTPNEEEEQIPVVKKGKQAARKNGKQAAKKKAPIKKTTKGKQPAGAEEAPIVNEEEIYRCICGKSAPPNTEYYSICCDGCEKWQHEECMGLDHDECQAKEHYYCEQCRPVEHHDVYVSVYERGDGVLAERKSNVKYLLQLAGKLNWFRASWEEMPYTTESAPTAPSAIGPEQANNFATGIKKGLQALFDTVEPEVLEQWYCQFTGNRQKKRAWEEEVKIAFRAVAGRCWKGKTRDRDCAVALGLLGEVLGYSPKGDHELAGDEAAWEAWARKSYPVEFPSQLGTKIDGYPPPKKKWRAGEAVGAWGKSEVYILGRPRKLLPVGALHPGYSRE